MAKNIWRSGSRKEVMDLLAALWPALDEAGRERLSEEIIAGPPPEMLGKLDEAERALNRDRRIFDRLIVLERVSKPPLTKLLLSEQQRLRKLYPNWSAQEGERAHFSTWMEFHRGHETKYSIEDLRALDVPALIGVILSEQEFRDGLLDVWRQFAIDDPSRALTVLEELARADDPGPPDVWRNGLWGCRDGLKDEAHRERVFRLLLAMPEALLQISEIASAAADVLDTVSKKGGDIEAFWLVFDRILPVVARTGENCDEPAPGEWVSIAINRSLGRLAEAFFNAMFSRRLKAGQQVPEDLRFRLDQLLQPGERANRLARVIAASRLSYLFAVDPDWTRKSLLPGFEWSDEGEASALWQGFAWQARIDPQLWTALKPNFLPMFTETRLQNFGEARRVLAQLLMWVAVNCDIDELPRIETSNAIRAMTNDMRGDAVAWLADYLEQLAGDQENDKVNDADRAWTERVAPWVRSRWPVDPPCRSPATSERFGDVVIATDAVFGEAIGTIEPFVVRTNGLHLVSRIAKSTHPDAHPRDTLRLIDLLVDPKSFVWGGDILRNLLERIAKVTPAVRGDQSFRNWDELLKVLGK